jgi:hypothetical protein
MTSAGFPHSETLGSQLVCQLPEDYRRLQRPSSAPSAKASTNVPLKTSGNTTITETKMTTKQGTTNPKAHGPTVSRSQSWKISKMLASTMQFSSNGRTHQANPYHHNRQAGGYDTNLVTRTRSRNTRHPPPKGRARRWSQDPTVCLANPTTQVNRVPTRDTLPKDDATGVLAVSPDRATLRQCSTHEQPTQTRTAWAWPLPPAPTCAPWSWSATPTVWGLVEMSSLERR